MPLGPLLAKITEVQLATLARAVPVPAAWTYELKWDGYRILAFKSGRDVRLVSRRGQDWTAPFAPVAAAVAAIRTRECVLDGEVCAIGPGGVPSFQLLQHRDRRGGPPATLVYFAFDLLWKDGDDLRDRPIEARRELLARVVGAPESGAAIVLSSASEGDPKQILAVACRGGLEGIVAKRKGSRYVGGRQPTWLKVKCTLRQEFAIAGYLPLLQTRDAVGGLVLALRGDDGAFHFAGNVGTGFDDATRTSLARRLDAHRIDKPAVVGAPRSGGITRWCTPKLVAEVEFTEWTEGGHVRHPSFRGLRDDKRPEDCVRERPATVDAPAPEPPAKKPARAKRGARIDVAGISVSHADRVLDPTGATKIDLARYYETVGPAMLPHVAGRPLTLLRWRDPGDAGDAGDEDDKGGVFLRHARAWGPRALRRVRIREKTKTGEYLVVDDVAGLVALAQMDVLEVHTWSSVAGDVEHPNRIVFDLDPAPDVAWSEVIVAAHHVRDRLGALGLASWPKTTGGKGLHLVVPLSPPATWDDAFAFSEAFARLLVEERPKKYVATVSKKQRTGKILIDYLRNHRASTSVAAFSPRARAGAPVSTPLAWDEVEPSLRNDAFTIVSVPERLRRHARDPWAGYWKARQRVPTGR